MSQFTHYVWEKHHMFMLVLVEPDERSFLLQINITKDITLIVQWVKDFSMISLLHIPCIMLLYGIWIAFSILVLTVNTQPAIACLGLAMEALEQFMVYVHGWWLCVYVCMYVFMYLCASVYIYICVGGWVAGCVCMCVYVCICIYVQYIYNIYTVYV